MDKAKYLAEVQSRFRIMFGASKEGYKIAESDRHRLEGFIQAGIFLGLTTMADMKETMEKIHYSVFGKSIAHRKQEQSNAWEEEGQDYTRYEIPTFLR